MERGGGRERFAEEMMRKRGRGEATKCEAFLLRSSLGEQFIEWGITFAQQETPAKVESAPAVLCLVCGLDP